MEPIRLAIVNDYELVVRGLAALVEGKDWLGVVDLSTDDQVDSRADIALYDTFGAADPDLESVRVLLSSGRVERVAVFTWAFDDEHIGNAMDIGASGFLSKSLAGDDLADALRRIHAGEIVVSDPPEPRASISTGRRWPGQEMALTEKEADVLALITQGLDNRSIADLLYISPNTLKTRVRGLYRKIGAENRVQAALWGIEHGFQSSDQDVRTRI
ncbi:LuxR C-terminal-related transcriptional regulator [Actinospongicola halichondriae]|uniref:LuxR C-terminal-related transcriptional regulator n=1 Tax=Actinospongicola halichondriae TaxID=3236844 RepID=UPI003D520FF1